MIIIDEVLFIYYKDITRKGRKVLMKFMKDGNMDTINTNNLDLIKKNTVPIIVIGEMEEDDTCKADQMVS